MVVLNLKAAKLAGQLSEAMILAADTQAADGTTVASCSLDQSVGIHRIEGGRGGGGGADGGGTAAEEGVASITTIKQVMPVVRWTRCGSLCCLGLEANKGASLIVVIA